MPHEPLKKVAVLTGLTMVIGGAEISQTSANTVQNSGSFSFNAPGPTPSFTNPVTFSPNFLAANPPSGTTLTEVDITLDSTVSSFTVGSSADVQLNGGTINSMAIPSTNVATAFDFTDKFTSPSDLANFQTTPNISLDLTSGGCEAPFCASWSSDTPTNLTLEYIYTPTPLPAALPLFATGIGGLGLLGWRRKRKAQVA